MPLYRQGHNQEKLNDVLISGYWMDHALTNKYLYYKES